MPHKRLFGSGPASPSASSPSSPTGSGGLFAEDEDFVPSAVARAEAVQRLQIGLFGIAAMILLVGLASIIGSQADFAEDAAVPEAAPTTEPTPEPTRANPLADAGVVPDIPDEPSPAPMGDPLVLPPPPTATRPPSAPPPQD